MNLSDFEMTTYSGLYVSKEAHVKYGKKYITRFQHDKKRYVKVLGFTKKDNLTKKDAFELLKIFKDSVLSKLEIKVDKKIKLQENKLVVKDNEILKPLKEEINMLVRFYM